MLGLGVTVTEPKGYVIIKISSGKECSTMTALKDLFYSFRPSLLSDRLAFSDFNDILFNPVTLIFRFTVF